MKIGVTGSGSWATALVKILTDNGHRVNWWIRQENMLRHIQQRRHNPTYLPSVNFDVSLLNLDTDLKKIIAASDTIVIATPSAYVASVLQPLTPADLEGKKILSAVKGILPGDNVLLNYYLEQRFDFPLEQYFAVLGPCHAEEVAAEKLSYLTFSGADISATAAIAGYFANDYINTVVNHDILGVQYAAVLKNIYAVGAGMAHGLEYGDNFLSVYIANAADEMAIFLRQFGAQHIVVGEHEGEDPYTHRKSPNYAASVYLGDLLVTCYSLYSRNRTFGNMIGKGYPVKSAILELNMVAEGYNAAKCIHTINQQVKAPMIIAETIYRILWEGLHPAEGFKRIEETLV
ncbi:MAG TPA: NAD(P)-binding domain-containing protein [Chitinophagaceae bacterium]|nr:NAD(P)-binding domain-containing protein [Chitinophagaceae bacterium]